jgi:hypothetical protein
MPTIEITSATAISRPTPVRIPLNGNTPPEAVALVSQNGGEPLPAQLDGDALVVVLPAIASGTTQYELSSANGEAAGVSLTEGDGTLAITLPEGEFSTYRFGSEVVRPYLWPLYGPGQHRVTRNYPMEEIEGEERDHPHHKSLWTAYGEVNDIDDWSEAEGHGYIRHQSFDQQEQGPVFGGFTARSTWVSRDEKPVLDEVRTVRIYNVGPEQRLLDYDVTLTAGYGDVEFGDTKEAGIISVRVASSMDGVRGGSIENANGGFGEGDCWGKPSAWCDYSGTVDGETLGIAVLNHPENSGGEPRWHVRAYGLMGTNPLATGSFTGEEGKAVTLQNGESLNYRYRVYIHRGDTRNSDVAGIYRGYITPPVATVQS